MPAGRYDINVEQGATLKLHLRYSDSNDEYIDLSLFTGRMQVRRSKDSDLLVLHLTNNGVTGGGMTGEFLDGGGISGTGDISFNVSSTGATGHTGGVLISIDAETMKNVPHGTHKYDFEIVTGEVVTRLIEGAFYVDRNVTR